jgi:hypothetical protein
MDAENDKYSSKQSTMPDLPSFDGISLRTLAPALQVQVEEPDYLDYDIKGRGMMEKTFFNSGAGWLAGSFAGAGYGLMQGNTAGSAAIQSPKLKVRVNTALNLLTRYGSRWGNAVGVLAIIYSLSDGVVEATGLENVPPLNEHPLVNPLVAATATGFLYKSAAGPRVALLSGVIGGGAVVGYYGVCKLTGMQFQGKRFMFF